MSLIYKVRERNGEDKPSPFLLDSPVKYKMDKSGFMACKKNIIQTIVFFSILFLLNVSLSYSQDNDYPKTNSFEFNVGYANFDGDFNGGFLSLGYNYHFNRNLMAQGYGGLELGKTSIKDGMGEDSYNAGILAVGPLVKLPFSNSHEVRFGGEFGIMLLNLNDRDITSNSLLFPFEYGFSGSYIYKVNKKINVGLSYKFQKTNKFGFSDQKLGLIFILKPN